MSARVHAAGPAGPDQHDLGRKHGKGRLTMTATTLVPAPPGNCRRPPRDPLAAARAHKIGSGTLVAAAGLLRSGSCQVPTSHLFDATGRPRPYVVAAVCRGFNPGGDSAAAGATGVMHQ